jgi:hypothetical protein
MQSRLPKTYGFLKQFEQELRQRSGFKQFFDVETAPFYSVYNVGAYSFAKYKVCWREVAPDLSAAVSSSFEGKVVTFDHTLVGISCQTEQEAHYLCALLNSAPANFVVLGYVTLHPSPAILKYIKIEKFDPKDKTHRTLAANSRALHEATAVGNTEKVAQLEAENLNLAAAYWGLEPSEVADIKASLEELA